MAALPALLAVSILVGIGAVLGSASIDGSRVFWLDDDQMISMCYARNLVEGHGLVFTAGERVEGYSNLLWTLVMALVHLLPLPAATLPLVIRLLNGLLACGVLLLTARLARAWFGKLGWIVEAQLLLVLALSADLIYWAAIGFETTLLTLLVLWILVRVVEQRGLVLTCALMALLPLVRADGALWWTIAAGVALTTKHPKRSVLLGLTLSLMPGLAHLLWRHAYYGQWLPNTFYLRVSAVDQRLENGWAYLVTLLRHYGPALPLAAWALTRQRTRRHWAVGGGIIAAVVYLVGIGGDMFPFSRYAAPLVPVLLVLAYHGTRLLGPRRWLVRGTQIALTLSLLALVGLITPGRLRMLTAYNGLPGPNARAGLTLDRLAAPDARVAALAVGSLAYYGRRHVVDLLGKTDHRIARLRARPNIPAGLNKLDLSGSLASRPDWLVSFWRHEWLMAPPPALQRDPLFMAFANNRTIRRHFLPHPITVPDLQPLALYRRGR